MYHHSCVSVTNCYSHDGCIHKRLPYLTLTSDEGYNSLNVNTAVTSTFTKAYQNMKVLQFSTFKKIYTVPCRRNQTRRTHVIVLQSTRNDHNFDIGSFTHHQHSVIRIHTLFPCALICVPRMYTPFLNYTAYYRI